MSTELDTLTTELESTDDRDVHNCLIKSPRQSIDPVDIALALRENIAEMPATKATFALEEIEGIDRPQAVPDDLLYLVGSWRLPAWYPDGSHRRQRWINPSYMDRRRYPDIDITCECGTRLVHAEPHRGATTHHNANDHSADCVKSWRLRARADLYDRRAEIIRSGLSFGHSVRSLTPRLGLAATATSTIIEGTQINREALEDAGRQRIAETTAVLLARHSIVDLAVVYGYETPGGLRRLVDRRTDTNRAALREQRERRAAAADISAKLDDVRRVAERTGCTDGDLLTTTYSDHGRWVYQTVTGTYGGPWAEVLDAAGVGGGDSDGS